MTVDKRFIHYTTNSHCDLYVHITFLDVIKCMYYSKNMELRKITLLLVNIIANTECQQSQNNATGVYVSLSLQSHQSPDVRHCLHLRTSVCQKVKS